MANQLHTTITVPNTNSTLNNVDGVGGSGTVMVPNEGSALTVTAAQGIPQPGAYGTIHGYIGPGTSQSVINNPA
jgi:hypothetical protein